ncbi:MAG: hypothetical protein ACK518_04040 [bacterium]
MEEDTDIELTKEAPKHIQRVSKDTVNKLLSAQVNNKHTRIIFFANLTVNYYKIYLR